MKVLRWPCPIAVLAAVLAAAALMFAGYVLDYLGLPINPLILACVAPVSAISAYRALRSPSGGFGFDLAALAVIVASAPRARESAHRITAGSIASPRTG